MSAELLVGLGLLAINLYGVAKIVRVGHRVNEVALKVAAGIGELRVQMSTTEAHLEACVGDECEAVKASLPRKRRSRKTMLPPPDGTSGSGDASSVIQ
jgi:hypothetical protein